MFEKYITSRKAVNEAGAAPAMGTASKENLEQAHSKRLADLLNIVQSDKSVFDKIRYHLALDGQEFVSFLDWAKNKVGVPSQAEETPSDTSDASMGGMDSAPSQDDESIKEAVAKANSDLEAAKNLKPRSEETEEEYLARRDSAIKAAIAAKEEAEEHAAMQSHYNTQNQALDLIDNLLKSPKKYQKADTIKILSLALDKLNGKA